MKAKNRAKVTIVLAEIHHFLAAQCRSLLKCQPDFLIVGESQDRTQTINLIESKKPDIIIFNRKYNEPIWPDEIPDIIKNTGETKVVVLSDSTNERDAVQILKEGAKAYITNESLSNELIRAIRAVSMGRCYLGSPLLERAIIEYLHNVGYWEQEPYDTLTGREKEVLQLIACGYTRSAIAEKLQINQRTVEGHRIRMLRKLSTPVRSE